LRFRLLRKSGFPVAFHKGTEYKHTLLDDVRMET
jgi:hypothetical protein